MLQNKDLGFLLIHAPALKIFQHCKISACRKFWQEHSLKKFQVVVTDSASEEGFDVGDVKIVADVVDANDSSSQLRLQEVDRVSAGAPETFADEVRDVRVATVADNVAQS